MKERKNSSYIRFLMSDKDIGWLIYSYAAIGFFEGNETNLIMAILREANSDRDCFCRIKQNDLAYYSHQSLSEMKRNLKSLIRLGIITSTPVKGGCIKYFNEAAFNVLKRIYYKNNKKSVCKLREEMKRMNVKSLLDVSDEMIKMVCEITGETYVEKNMVSPNMGQHNDEKSWLQGTFEKSMVTADNVRIELINRKNNKQKNT